MYETDSKANHFVNTKNCEYKKEDHIDDCYKKKCPPPGKPDEVCRNKNCCHPQCPKDEHCSEPCRQWQKQCQGNQEQKQGDLSEAQGDLTETQGDLSQVQGDLSETLGDLSETQGDLTESQGDLSQVQGDLSETLGDLSETQGDLSQTQGDLSETLGDLSETQGDLSQTQGDLTESLGDTAQTQGNLSETLGDQAQTQGDLSETLGDQTQSMTGHGGQTQGDQTQGNQTQGDQTLSSSPTISTPVTVSGVNLNVNVCCGGKKKKKKKKCKDNCRTNAACLLELIAALQDTITDPADSTVGFYYDGPATPPAEGNLTNVIDKCLFTILPTDGTNSINIATDALEALTVTNVSGTPNLFGLLQTYLQNTANANVTLNGYGKGCCSSAIAAQLEAYQTSGTPLQVNTTNGQFTGYVYRVTDGVLYLVDNLETPTQISAILLCKITSYQPQS